MGVLLWEYSCHYINSKQRSFFPLFITKEAAHTHTHTHTHKMFLKAQRSKTNNCEYPHQGKPQRCQDVSVFCTPLRVCVRAKSLQSCPTLCNPVDCSPPGSSVHGDSPGRNTRVNYCALLQGIFPTQGSNLGLLHCRWVLYQLSHQGSPGSMLDTT